MIFLGICSYCSLFVPNFSILKCPLCDIKHTRSLSASSHITWIPEVENSFVNLKKALQTTPTLGVPNPDKPFVQCVNEKEEWLTSALLQKHGCHLKPVAYFSSTLDPVAKALLHCLSAVWAAEKAVLASRNFVGFSDLTFLILHAVSALLEEQKTSHLSAVCCLGYHTILLPHVTVKKCNTF